MIPSSRWYRVGYFVGRYVAAPATLGAVLAVVYILWRTS